MLPRGYMKLNQFTRLIHHKVSPKEVGISLVKNQEKLQDECPYESFQQFNVQTKDRRHSFEVPCDKVVKFIKLGAINKQIATQYCHYLAELTRIAETPDDTAYYGSKCIDLMSYLLKNHKDVPVIARNRLVSDCADTTKENCSLITSKLQLKQETRITDLTQVLGACYKFCLWEEADRLISEAPTRLITFRLADRFVEGFIRASEDYKHLAASRDDQASLRARVIKSLAMLCRYSSSSRAQFITKRKADFVQALKDLDINVKINPVIKMSGRCTGCETHLPLFDHKLVATINASIKSQMMKGAEKGIFLNTSPNDINRFEEFLRELFDRDKKPIDCVIDGLNIAYRSALGFSLLKKNISDVSRTFKIPKPESQAQVLINSIIRGGFLSRFRKILVVGKWHMTKWPGLMDFFETHNIHFYSSYNNSEDDLFQLLAATLNPKTVFVTNDFLRDHLAQLDEEDRTLLERWIDTHQAWISQTNLRPIWPTPFEKIPCADDSGTIFHLPVVDFHQLDAVGVYEPPPHLNSKILTWVCCDTR